VFEALYDILVDIEADSVRAGKVISAVRALFRDATDKRVMTRVEDLVRQALSLAEPDLLGRDVSVTTQFQEFVPHVYVDPAQLQQVLLNLIRNGIDAMDLIPPDQRHLRLTTELGDRSNVLISIRDTGVGIPEEAQHRVFDSFFTTKPSGMGLELVISRTIIESHDGSLHLVESGPHGSTFEISLPIGSAIKKLTR
jgi:signal transduction histidine kinase